ncbi:MAG: hypothetical protein AAGJ85_08245, partial [Pseudomonadota bacterium]
MKRSLLMAASVAVLAAPTVAQELPPGNPLPGECFARVIVPAQYETSTEQIVLRPATEEIRVIPAQLETVTERVLVQEESFELVPAGAGAGTRLVPGTGRITLTIGGTTYAVDPSNRALLDSRGQRVGTIANNGDLVANDGSLIAAGAVDPVTFIGIGSGVSTRLTVGGTAYAVDSGFAVRNSDGQVVGRIEGGNLVGTNGRVITRSAVNSFV